MSSSLDLQAFFNNAWKKLDNLQNVKAFYPVKWADELSELLDNGSFAFYTDSDFLYPQQTIFKYSTLTARIR